MWLAVRARKEVSPLRVSVPEHPEPDLEVTPAEGYRIDTYMMPGIKSDIKPSEVLGWLDSQQ